MTNISVKPIPMKINNYANACLAIAILALMEQANAISSSDFLPKEYQAIDENHVDLASQDLKIRIQAAAIGTANNQLAENAEFGHYLELQYDGFFLRNQIEIPTIAGAQSVGRVCSALYGGSSTAPSVTVHTGRAKTDFCVVNGAYLPTRDTAASLVANNDGSFTFVNGAGHAHRYERLTSQTAPMLVSIVRPDGQRTELTYRNNRVELVSRNDGFQLVYQYDSNWPQIWIQASSPQQVSVTAINNAIDYCNPASASCQLAAPTTWPNASYVGVKNQFPNGLNTVSQVLTDSRGRVFKIQSDYNNDQLFKLRYTPPEATTDFWTYGFCQDVVAALTSTAASQTYLSQPFQRDVVATDSNGNAIKSPDGTTIQTTTETFQLVEGSFGTSAGSTITPGAIYLCRVDRGAGMWTYGTRAVATPHSTPIIKNIVGPTGSYRGLVTMASGVVEGIEPLVAPLRFVHDQDSHRRFRYDPINPTNRLQAIEYPEGNYTQYDYDARGNVKQVTHQPKPGSTQTPLYEYADYDVTCVYPAKCNKPNWIKDANGNQTDFTYDTTHGGVLTKNLSVNKG